MDTNAFVIKEYMHDSIKCFEKMGFKILTKAKKTANGPDMHVQKKQHHF